MLKIEHCRMKQAIVLRENEVGRVIGVSQTLT
jgi:hypothetical protein